MLPPGKRTRGHYSLFGIYERVNATCVRLNATCTQRSCISNFNFGTDQPERGHYESDSMAVKIDTGDDNPPADPCCMADKVVCGISASLFGMDFLSAGQCATGNGGPFVLNAAVARGGSASNADRWICDFYDTTGGRQRSSASGTGGSNASAGVVHIR